MADRTTPESRLAALGAQLSSRGFSVDLTERGLVVTNPAMPGCCEETAHASDTITCRARRDDGDRMWFWTSWGEPITEAEKITDATLRIRGNLAGRHVSGREHFGQRLGELLQGPDTAHRDG